MADDLKLEMRIRALVQGAREVDALAKDLQNLAGAAKQPLPDHTGPFRGGLSKAGSAVGNLRNLIVGLGGALAAFKGFQLAAGALRAFVREGIGFNATVEQARLGIATLITAQTTLTDASGKTLTGQEALSAAMRISEKEVLALRIAGIQTSATFEQLLESYQQAMGPGLGAGLGLEEVRGITVKIVQAAGTLRVPMNQVGQEVRAILEGSIDVNARIANALGITNEMVKNWKSQGTLVEELNKRLEAFAVAGIETAKTWGAVTSNLQDAVSIIAGEVTRPLFEATKAGLGEVLGQVFDLEKGEISASFQGLVTAGQEVAAAVGDLLGEALVWVVVKVQELSAWLSENKKAVSETVVEAGRFVREIGVLLAKAIGVVAQIVKMNVETGALTMLFRGLGYLVAYIQDGWKGIGAVVALVGASLVKLLVTPLTKAADLVLWMIDHAKGLPGMGFLDKVDTAGARDLLRSIKEVSDEFAGRGFDYAGDVAAGFLRGETAVNKFRESLKETKKEVAEVKKAVAEPLPTVTPKGRPVAAKESSEAKAIARTIKALRLKAATLGYTSRQEAVYKLLLDGATEAQIAEADTLLASIEKHQLAEEIRKQQVESHNQSIDAARQEAEAVRDMLTPLREIEAEIARIRELTRGGFLNPEEAEKRIRQIQAQWKASTSAMTKLGMGVAQSFQQALGEFLFDPFKEGLRGMLSGFVDMVRKMVAEALAAAIMKKLLGDYGSTGQAGGWFGMIMQAFASRHAGGLVTEGGPQRFVSPVVFIGAPRLHAGGLLGLDRDEVPIVARRDEEVLTRDDPRHSLNGGGGGGGGVRVVNVIDPNLVHDYMQSSSGEKVLLNVIQKNAGAVRQVLG